MRGSIRLLAMASRFEHCTNSDATSPRYAGASGKADPIDEHGRFHCITRASTARHAEQVQHPGIRGVFPQRTAQAAVPIAAATASLR